MTCPRCEHAPPYGAMMCDVCNPEDESMNRYITMQADDLGPVAQEIDLALLFDEPAPLPGPGEVREATSTPVVYELDIAGITGIAMCETCGNAASADARWCRGCAP